MRNLLDLHAAGGGRDEGDASALAVQGQRHVDLTRDVGAGLDVHPLDRQTFSGGLRRHQALAEELAGRCTHGVQVPHELHAARFAAPAGMHLGLHHPDTAPHGARGRGGFLRACRHLTRGNADAVAAEQFLRLVFVKVHCSAWQLKKTIFAKKAGTGQ